MPHVQIHMRHPTLLIPARGRERLLKSQNLPRERNIDILSSVDFIPIALETSGAWGKEGLKLMLEIGRRTAEMNKDPRSTAFLFQRISIALQRGNAQCVMEMCSSEYGNQTDPLDQES